MRKKRERKIFDQVEVFDAGAKGKSVGKAPDGKVIFISNAVPGDVAEIQTTKKRRAYYEGVATKFHKLSDKRTEPVCEHFGTCGGCKWQNMAYEHQLYYKQKEVVNNLHRIGHLDLPPVLPIIGSERQYFYRNKMEFSFSDSRWLTLEEINSEEEIADRNALGFHIPGMWDKVLDIRKCHLQRDPSNAIRLAVREYAIKNNMPFFNPRRQEGLLRTLMIRTSSTGELMVLVQFYEDDESLRTNLLSYLEQQFPEISSLLYVINRKQNDTIYDQEVICFAGKDHIFEEIEDLRYKITAKSFYQTNSEQAVKLYEVVANFAALNGKELVYDLYTGTGTIAQYISKNARKVIGIESVPEAITAAKENAVLNKIENVDFFVGDMRKAFTDEFIATHGQPHLIITDPPRDGMHKDVVNQILNTAPEKLIYVSCNSATQARDLAILDARYKVMKIQPVDMFPQTHHVENVVLLEKRPTAND